MVLALKLAEVRELTQRLGAAPILLLDDVSSELDSERTELLFSVIDEIAGQVWVSSTGAAPLPIRIGTQILEVSSGAIEDITKNL
jgi:DNA replication and repair protein RecF